MQLYGIRSRRNWGHGDFTDLANLIDIAAALGAAAIGLNPLHALFDDRPEEASPYFPNSRHFLNPLYIDVEAIPEFPQAARAKFQSDIEALREKDLVDYVTVASIKAAALALAYDNFYSHGSDARRQQFDAFRRERGSRLAAFAAFELLRRRFKRPWWEWPDEWRKPDRDALARLRTEYADELAFVEYMQWIADQQLVACRDRARDAGLADRALSRPRGRRPAGRLRRLVRAGFLPAEDRDRRAAGRAQHARPALGPGRRQSASS